MFVIYKSIRIFDMSKGRNKIIHIQKYNIMTTLEKNYQFTKSFVYENRIYTNVKTWDDAKRISLIGAKSITRKQRKQLFEEYKQDQELDWYRLRNGVSINLQTNLNVTKDNYNKYLKMFNHGEI